MIRFLEAKMKQQKEDYEKLLADYNRLRDIKHDLYNYVHILDLAGDVRKEQEQIRQLQEDLKPGKQKEYIKYTNLSILNLVLNNVTSACEGAGIHPEVAAEEIQIDTNVELDMGYLIERMVHNVILLNEDQERISRIPYQSHCPGHSGFRSHHRNPQMEIFRLCLRVSDFV